MKERCNLAKSSYVPSPAIFAFNKAAVVAIVINSASFEVWFAVNTCFGVTKRHHFVTNKVYFVTNKVYFATNKVYFVAKQHSFLTKKLCFVAKQSTNINR